MKRTAILLTLFVVCQTGWAEHYYESNALGLPIREIKEFRVDEFEYVLKIDEQDGRVIKTLLKDEVEYKRWEIRYTEGKVTSESLYVDGVLSESRKYDGGALIEEVSYADGNVAEKRTYDYSSGYLREVKAVDGEGNLLYTDVYERAADGRLRRIKRLSDKETEESAFVYSDGKLVEEWHGSADEGLLFRYHDGEKLAEETWEGLKLLLSEEVKTFEGTQEVVVKDTTLGTTTTRYYDEENRVKIERTETDDDLVEYVRYDYEGENMTDKTRITRTAKEDWRYEYDEEGGLIRETLVRNGNIVKEIVHTEEGKYYEVIYRDGAPSLRVYFEDGEKVDEEFLGGGEAVQ